MGLFKTIGDVTGLGASLKVGVLSFVAGGLVSTVPVALAKKPLENSKKSSSNPMVRSISAKIARSKDCRVKTLD